MLHGVQPLLTHLAHLPASAHLEVAIVTLQMLERLGLHRQRQCAVTAGTAAVACTGGKLDSTEQHLCIKHIGSTVCCVVRTAAVALQMHNLGVLPARSDAGHQTDMFHEKGLGWRGTH